ncbi:MAG: M1 family metallopeptidase, partial [Actinomycetota bacterium]|nr:M1 family metallopeptidase [Actinomycetota bacterium]
PFLPGARSAGDRLFPSIGNGGYDVGHYDLELDYEPVTDTLLGEATIRATATHNLSEFSLDFHGLTVSAVQVDGRDALHTRDGDKLIVTPPAGIPAGSAFTTTVAYGGTIVAYTDPDGSHEGWVPTPDGAFVVNEPVGAMSWFPNNNVPTDKALYDVKVTVPPGSTVFGNGRLVSHEGDTWHWREDRPMATYLTTATNGAFVRQTDETDPAIPHEYGVDPAYGPAAVAIQQDLESSPAMTQFFADTLGSPYPFTSSGGVVDVSDVGYALESQTRPMYALPPGVATIAHEIAHQWFGNSVSPATWSDIWLNEGPAEFYSWLWEERENGGTPTPELFTTHYEDSGFDWSIPPAQPPSAEDLFNTDAMYNRGAMVMEALRQIVGEERFLELCRAWLSEHAYGHASTADFIALFRERGGVDRRQLDKFFREWLYTSYPSNGRSRPAITPENFGTYVG